jgi:hypothetical protein
MGDDRATDTASLGRHRVDPIAYRRRRYPPGDDNAGPAAA